MVENTNDKQVVATWDPEAEVDRLMAKLDEIDKGITAEVEPLINDFEKGIEELEQHTVAAEQSVKGAMDTLAQQQYRDALRYAGAMDRAKDRFDELELEAQRIEQENLQPPPLEALKRTEKGPKKTKKGA